MLRFNGIVRMGNSIYFCNSYNFMIVFIQERRINLRDTDCNEFFDEVDNNDENICNRSVDSMYFFYR